MRACDARLADKVAHTLQRGVLYFRTPVAVVWEVVYIHLFNLRDTTAILESNQDGATVCDRTGHGYKMTAATRVSSVSV